MEKVCEYNSCGINIIILNNAYHHAPGKWFVPLRGFWYWNQIKKKIEKIKKKKWVRITWRGRWMSLLIIV